MTKELTTKELPFISCLMITGKTKHHRKLARVAVDCFLNQTYAGPMELVVINTATDKWIENKDYHKGREAPRKIREIMVRADVPNSSGVSRKLTLGELRNISMEEAQGEYFCQWDDDDFHGKERVAKQWENFVPGAINILRSQYRINIINGRWGLADAGGLKIPGVIGTMFHSRELVFSGPNGALIGYPHRRKAEDRDYIRMFPYHVYKNPASLYVRLYHGNNTWHRQHIMKLAVSPKNLRREDKKDDASFIEYVKSLYRD